MRLMRMRLIFESSVHVPLSVKFSRDLNEVFVPFISGAVTVVLPCRSVNPVVSGRESGAPVHS